MMMNLDLPTILGIIGNVTSFFMFCSLAPTIWRIYLQKDNEEYKFHPIVAGLISCSMWVLYSMPFVHSNPHTILLTPVNCVGIALYIFYYVVYSYYGDSFSRICNAAGAILAVAQLILYTWYYVSAQKESIETLPTPPHHDSRKSSMVILVSYYDKEP